MLTNNFAYKEEAFMNKKIKTLFSYLMIIVGAILASFSVACILLPNDAIDYGTAGIAIIISKQGITCRYVCCLCFCRFS